MKKFLCGILSLNLLLLLAGCGKKQPSETDMAPEEMVKAIAESQEELPDFQQATFGEADFSSWLTIYYQIPDDQVEDGAVCYEEGVEASEIAVLKLVDGADAEEIKTALTEYKENRAGVFEGYAPLQAALARDGLVFVHGKYVVLLICEDTSAAEKAFFHCFEREENRDSVRTEQGGEKKEQEDGPSPDESNRSADDGEGYDEAAVLSAWESGDDSALSGENRQILEAARDVIDQEIKENMSDYEKELAIHDWITGWSSFDYAVFGRSASEGFADGSDTPYGVLINRSAMCHGYSSTFQLFMDMLHIECITVYGTPGGNGVEHSWNMVRLDGDWYCVDAAWDDPIGGSPGHTYFNVTSDYLRSGSIHRWDDTAVPEADGTAYAYGRQ